MVASHADAIGWLTAVIRRLLDRGQSLSRLMRMKHVLARRLRMAVADLKATARGREARRWLIDPGAPVEALASEGFVFRDGMFDGVRPYRGRKRFNKHFLPVVPFFDGDDGDEVECAVALDALQAVRFWSRNVSTHPNAFWLQTSRDKTYPDFVAKLTDGRIFVVEYKGDRRLLLPEFGERARCVIGRARPRVAVPQQKQFHGQERNARMRSAGRARMAESPRTTIGRWRRSGCCAMSATSSSSLRSRSASPSSA